MRKPIFKVGTSLMLILDHPLRLSKEAVRKAIYAELFIRLAD